MNTKAPEWHIEKVSIDKLIAHVDNPRKLSEHDKNHLIKSLENFGQCEPIVINDDGKIIGGHQRVKVAELMGLYEVDVSVPNRHLNDKEVKELNIRLNRNAGEWDHDILSDTWENDDLISWGFTSKELGIDKNTEVEDISDDIETEYKVEVQCIDEIEQEKLFVRLEAEGFKCRLLSL